MFNEEVKSFQVGSIIAADNYASDPVGTSS